MSSPITFIILVKNIIGVKSLKIRVKAYGNCNMVGKTIERLRKAQGIKQKDFISKMQIMGCDINPTSYSKLEGQIRIVSDKELYVIAKLLNVTIDSLFEADN